MRLNVPLRRPDKHEQLLIQWHLDEHRETYEPMMNETGVLYIGIDEKRNVIIKTEGSREHG